MISRNSLITLLALIVSLLMFVYETNSSSSQPPAGNNGAPNTTPPNQTCGQCHSGSASKDATTNVDFTFSDGINTYTADNFLYELNKQYVVSFSPTPLSKRYGFQMSALNTSNQNGGALSLITANTGNTAIITIPSGTYVSHKNATSFHSWSFNWTAPTTDIGDITFYYAFNAADSSNDENGDTIYVGHNTIRAAPTSVKETHLVSDFSIYPNPASKTLNISFSLLQEQRLSLSLVSLEGKIINEFYPNNTATSLNETFDISNITPGIYLLQLKGTNAVEYKKLVIQ